MGITATSELLGQVNGTRLDGKKKWFALPPCVRISAVLNLWLLAIFPENWRDTLKK